MIHYVKNTVLKILARALFAALILMQRCSEQEILDKMRNQGVIAVRRVKICRDGSIKDTFVFTFDTTVLPKQVKVAFLRVSVDPYIPNPLRCNGVSSIWASQE